MGSEFAYEDISSQEIEKYTYTFIEEGVLNGVPTYLIERVPTDEKSGYTRQRVWYDQAEYRLQQIEFYDRKDALLKTLTYHDYQQYVDQYWRADRMEMVNHQTRKSTTLAFSEYALQVGLNERDFDQSALQRAALRGRIVHLRFRTIWVLAGAYASLGLATPEPGSAQLLTGEASLEARGFANAPLYAGQDRNDGSLVLVPEFYVELGPGGIIFEPFARFDLADSERTHYDVRTLSWEGAVGDWEFNLGMGRVFWGVTESQHLVDIVNQTDFVENPDGEDKLGQPMINIGRVTNYGVFEVFVLPGFRERTFAGSEGRLRPGLVVDTEAASYESDDGSRHVDFAARWSHFIGAFDVGASWFRGTNREPRILVEGGADSPYGTHALL